MNSKRKNQTRLKLYIPEEKISNWSRYMEDINPYSDYFYNFSKWVRICLSNIPLPGQIPVYPSNSSKTKVFSGKKMEKTIWVPESIKKAVYHEKGFFSLNSFIILILDLNIYGGISDNIRNFQIINLQKKLDKIEFQIRSLLDEAYSKNKITRELKID